MPKVMVVEVVPKGAWRLCLKVVPKVLELLERVHCVLGVVKLVEVVLEVVLGLCLEVVLEVVLKVWRLC